MEKLFNWTIGSFFRTIGRLIAYFAIGAFIAYILGHSNIDLGGITNLFYTKVNASTIADRYQPTIRDSDGQLQQVGNFFRIPISYNSSTGYYSGNKNFYLSNDGVPTGASKVQFNYKYSKNDGYDQSFILYYDSQTEDYRASVGNFSIYFKIIYQDDNNGYYGGICTPVSTYISEEQQFLIECNVPPEAKKVAWVEHNINISPSSYDDGGNYDIFIGDQWQYIVDDGQSIINNQNQNTQSVINNNNQNHNETMTIITDTNTTQEQNETTTFFEDFQFSSDSTGLVGVITAPLRVFTAISEGTFSDLCFTLKGKQTCFPNGNMIWQKTERTSSFFGSGSIATGIQAFVTLFNLVAGGYLLYKMGASVKRLTEELIDPRNTRIEVMKL